MTRSSQRVLRAFGRMGLRCNVYRLREIFSAGCYEYVGEGTGARCHNGQSRDFSRDPDFTHWSSPPHRISTPVASADGNVQIDQLGGQTASHTARAWTHGRELSTTEDHGAKTRRFMIGEMQRCPSAHAGGSRGRAQARQRWDSPGARGGMAAEGERARPGPRVDARRRWAKCDGGLDIDGLWHAILAAFLFQFYTSGEDPWSVMAQHSAFVGHRSSTPPLSYNPQKLATEIESIQAEKRELEGKREQSKATEKELQALIDNLLARPAVVHRGMPLDQAALDRAMEVAELFMDVSGDLAGADIDGPVAESPVVPCPIDGDEHPPDAGAGEIGELPAAPLQEPGSGAGPSALPALPAPGAAPPDVGMRFGLPHNLGALEAFDALEVLLLARSLQSASPVQRQGMSDGARRARDALAESPHSMLWINELGRIYADEAQWDKCEIALLRGWKRAGEIEDPGVRLCFLLKLCEVSYYLRKHKQAMAVLKDIDEPEAPDEFQAYLLLACRVHACNNDLEGAMRFFSRAIERETFQSSLKVLALTMFDLQKAGAYEPAKHAVESMAGSCDKDQLRIFDDALEQRERPGAKIDRLFMYALMGAKVFAILCVVFLLYQWEQSSLERRIPLLAQSDWDLSGQLLPSVPTAWGDIWRGTTLELMGSATRQSGVAGHFGLAGFAGSGIEYPTSCLSVLQADRKLHSVAFCNYFGVGVDARIASRFDQMRRCFPRRFKNRTLNKVHYFWVGAIEFFASLRNSCTQLSKEVALRCDGMDYELGRHVKGIIFSNINSYGGGSKLTAQCCHQDGKLDVVLIRGPFGGVPHLALVKLGLARGHKLCQAKTVELTNRTAMPIQVDGEPWEQPPSRIEVTPSFTKASMLQRSDSEREGCIVERSDF
ncbi:unnamed protein product [Prorocentrum cordatum]|uniref:Diacylglycerol kinase accessory domain-containing protein n=1 Tax=Prorocentrum cordatum TaxID=2364126 RepID=A0ABN9U715_9DINO|nr:unnamed protein product [Polarella glacialis]